MYPMCHKFQSQEGEELVTLSISSKEGNNHTSIFFCNKVITVASKIHVAKILAEALLY